MCCVKTCISFFKLEPKQAQRHRTRPTHHLIRTFFPSLDRKVSAGLRIHETLESRATDFLKWQNFSWPTPAVTICPLFTVGSRAINYWISVSTSRIFEILSHYLCPGTVVYLYLWTPLWNMHWTCYGIKNTGTYTFLQGKNRYKLYLFLCSRFHTFKHFSVRLFKNHWYKGIKDWKRILQSWTYMVKMYHYFKSYNIAKLRICLVLNLVPNFVFLNDMFICFNTAY